MSMRLRTRRLALALSIPAWLIACGDNHSAANAADAPIADTAIADAAIDAGEVIVRRALGMNDVTILLPLPAHPSETVLLRINGSGPGTELVPRAIFEHIDAAVPVTLDYAQYHVVALRFDLCERHSAATCAAGVDGQLRLVLQEADLHSSDATVIFDRALHALYPIPAIDVPHVINELRALAVIADVPITSPLLVNAAVTAGATYADRLRALVTRYARSDRLSRLAMFINEGGGIGISWVFGGVDVHGGGSELSELPLQGLFQHGGPPIISPFSDTPRGLAIALDQGPPFFFTASDADRMLALQAAAEAENPRKRGFDDLQCVACHMSSSAGLAHQIDVDPGTIPGRFSTTYDVSVDAFPSRFRGIGYDGKYPMIAQRVANETAALLTEISTRFPLPQ